MKSRTRFWLTGATLFAFGGVGIFLLLTRDASEVSIGAAEAAPMGVLDPPHSDPQRSAVPDPTDATIVDPETLFTESRIRAFRTAFQREYQDLGGLNREYEHVEKQRQAQLESGTDSIMTVSIRSYGTGMSQFPPLPDSPFLELYPHSETTAVTWLNYQSHQLEQWLKKPEDQRQLPLDLMLIRPLAYPPELYLTQFSREAGSLDAQTRERIARMRDQCVIEDALLAGEQFLMRPSAQVAFAEVFPELKGKSPESWLGILLPEWAELEQARKDVQQRYRSALETEFALLR